MNSTEKAWRAFAKAEGIVEDVPSKDVSLEGKLDVLSAQMNQISVDTQRVADVVPELLGDEGVEEALKQEEDSMPPEEEGEEVEKDDDAEGSGEEIALSESGEEAPAEEETVGDDEDPEGIFTEDEPAEDGEEVEETEPIAEGEPAEVEAEPDAEGDEQEDDAQDITEEEGSEEVVEETVDEEPAEEKEVVVEKKPVEEPKKKVILTKSKGGKYMKKKSNFASFYKSDEVKEETVPQDIENSADAKVEDSDEIKCSEGAATAGSAGVSNAVFGEDTEKIIAAKKSIVLDRMTALLKALDDMNEEGRDDEETQAFMESIADDVDSLTENVEKHFIQKYGTPGHTGMDQGTGQEGVGESNSYRNEMSASGKPHPAHPPRGSKNTKRHNWTRAQREKENAKKRKMRAANYPNYDKRLREAKQKGTSRGSAAQQRANKGKKKSKKSFLDIYQPGPLAIQKTVEASEVPTKHVANMMEVQTHQRPVVKATANGDIVRPTLETAPVKKNIPMGYGVSPADATAGDWADYNAYKARMGLR